MVLLALSCFVPGVSTIKENKVNHAKEYQEYMNDWFVHLDNQINTTETQGSGVEIEGAGVNLNHQVFESVDGPMDSAWPMQSHDVHHTGLSPYSTANNSGLEKWFVEIEYGQIESSAVIDKNGTIYFGTMGADYSLYALYSNGTRKWKYQANGEIWSTPAIAEDGTIYVPTWGSKLIALDPNGHEKWIFSAQDPVSSSLTVGADGTIYLGTMGGYLFAVYPNGSEQWHLYLGGNLISSPAIGTDNIIYIGTTSHYLYAVNPNGTLRWQFGAGQFKGNPSIAEDGTIYAPSFDGYLYALNPNGTMKWRASTGGNVSGAGVALAEDGTIYIGTEQLRAYYPNGTLKWSADVQGDIYGTVPAVSADGTIYVSVGLDLVAVNSDGTERWRHTIADTHAYSSPSIGADGTVYVGSTWGGIMPYGYFYAFGSLDSNAPIEPTITGQTNGKIKRTYDYTFTSTSPLENKIYYLIDWGDGVTTDWLGPYNSGEIITMSHSWSEKGTYTIKARAKDTDNRWGPWGTLSVNMPCSYDKPIMNFLEKLLEWYPNAFPILRYFLNK